MSTPVSTLFASCVMTCTVCGKFTGCSCWIDCSCGWNRERGQPCTNKDCEHTPRNVPKMNQATWVLLIKIDEARGAGLKVEPARKRAADKLLKHGLVAHHPVVAGLVVVTRFGAAAVKYATMLCDETNVKA